MALQMELETLDGLEESTQKLYVEKDGKFVLDVDGHVKNEDHNTIPKARLDQEIEKRKASDGALNELAEELKKDVPQEKQDLIPDLPPLKLVKWLRKAIAQGIFNDPTSKEIDSKRPGDKKPQDLDGLSPQQKMARGYKT